MPTDGITQLGGSAAAAPRTAATGLGSLDSDAFLKLLVAQLRYQNPMSPTDGSAMLQQSAQFTQVETLKQLATAQKELLGYHQTGVAAGLVGKEVTVVGADGLPVRGLVDAVRFVDKGPVLMVGGREYALDHAIEIRVAPAPAPAPTATQPPPAVEPAPTGSTDGDAQTVEATEPAGGEPTTATDEPTDPTDPTEPTDSTDTAEPAAS